MFEEIEINPKAAGLAGVFTLFFIGMVWKLSIWAEYPKGPKIIMSVVMFPLLYFVVDHVLNK